ncbi:ECF transporter S component [Gottfriedia acidiceleris]|uniref:ECF transporter S component n=1 Tax=Gottfriedia acidiceleris TaxID=371036 RepID=A0ABY4JIR7_9BACI|nr:ECF transporter S component [Gottfriedia acidiceleris]UPM53728.1 ECF transporter S component [Gottfriedia acidiceleris]
MNTKRIVLLSLFIALSAVLSNIKIVYSIAFDSLPAFLAAMLISPIAGGIVGALGHLLTAITSGFPFTVPVHLFIAIQMLVIVWLFGVLFKKMNQYIAMVVAIILNGPVATLLSSLLIAYLNHSFTAKTISSFFILMVVPLTIASAANIVLAFILQKVMKRANFKI